MKIFFKLTKYVNGGMIYIPIPELVVREARNREIYSEWKSGKCKKELSRKYGLSIDRVTKIIEKIRKNHWFHELSNPFQIFKKGKNIEKISDFFQNGSGAWWKNNKKQKNMKKIALKKW